MKLLKLENITGEEELARAIMTDDYKELLSEGARLKKEYVPKLKELGITEVYVKDKVSDPKTLVILKEEVNNCVKELSNEIMIHDFRAVLGNTYSKLIFDCMIPYSCMITQEEIQEHIEQMLSKKDHPYYSVITFERPFNG